MDLYVSLSEPIPYNIVPGLYSTKFNFSCTTVTIRRPEGKIGDTRYINLGLI